MRRTPVLIVGGGPAGSAAAITLARGGVRAELIEKTSGDHEMVCGGFLGWDALAALRRLGIDPEALGAKTITRARFVVGGRSKVADLPHRAVGLSRRRLDAALLAAAEAAGARVSRGRTARSADWDTGTVRMDDGEAIRADALFLATGKHELRGLARPVERERDALAIGLRVALPVSCARSAALAGFIELHPFDEGYAGLLLQEDGTTNLCLSTSRRRLTTAGGVGPLIQELVDELPLLGERMADDTPLHWDAIAGVPYGWRARDTEPGLFRLGDQGAVIASLAGDGVAIALTSGLDAAGAMLAGGGAAAPAWQRHFYRKSALPIGAAQTLRWAAERELPRTMLFGLIGLAPQLASKAARLTRIERRRAAIADLSPASEPA